VQVALRSLNSTTNMSLRFMRYILGHVHVRAIPRARKSVQACAGLCALGMVPAERDRSTSRRIWREAGAQAGRCATSGTCRCMRPHARACDCMRLHVTMPQRGERGERDRSGSFATSGPREPHDHRPHGIA
jgi:hypothetical protein